MEQAEVTSLIPIIITLVLALTTRNGVVGLFAGVVSGVAMLEGTFVDKGPLDSFSVLMKSYLLPQVNRQLQRGCHPSLGLHWWLCCPNGEIWRWRGVR